MDLVHRAVTAPGERPGERGFSLIEVLIASLILLILLLGIIPLFVRSSVNRVHGRESSIVSSFARSRAEELLQLPFDHLKLTVPSGDTELDVVEYRVPASDTWSEDPSLAGQAQWVRTTRVRQFGTVDLLDGDTDGDGNDLDSPLPGGTNPRSVQLKEIQVEVTSPRQGGPLGRGKELSIRVLKAF